MRCIVQRAMDILVPDPDLRNNLRLLLDSLIMATVYLRTQYDGGGI